MHGTTGDHKDNHLQSTKYETLQNTHFPRHKKEQTEVIGSLKKGVGRKVGGGGADPDSELMGLFLASNLNIKTCAFWKKLYI